MLNDSDPVYNCKLYTDEGCSHVDGFLCDFPKCSMLKEYLEEGMTIKDDEQFRKDLRELMNETKRKTPFPYA